jgi:hypothetical protein
MDIRTGSFFAAWRLVVILTIAPVAVAETPDSEGYFMQAKVTKINVDRTIDFWVTSVHRLPRQQSATGTDLSQLPRVIATLDFKSEGVSAGARDSGLRGARISLRGKCEDLDRATRVPVIQVRLGLRQPWQQAKLEPRNRAGHTGFQQLVAGVCGPDPASEPASADGPDGPD